MRVRHAMTSNVLTVMPDDRAWTAAEVVTRVGISGLPVVDADHDLTGMVTDLDLIRASLQGGNLDMLTVREVMRYRSPITTPDAELYDAAALMNDWRVRLVPVIEDRRLVGIISRGDVLRGLARRDGRPMAAAIPTDVPHGSGQPCTCVSRTQTWELGGEG